MKYVESTEALEALYGTPSAPSLRKVAHRMTPLYRKWIMASRFCVVSTTGPEGTDASPRGDDGPVVVELDPGTLAMPDWRGNNRLDTLRNIVTDGRISLLFLVPGENTVVRVNGTARLTADATMTGRFEQRGKHPATVIVIDIAEVYSQCPKAMMRAGLWSRNDADQVPTLGQILQEMTSGDIDAGEWDEAYSERAKKTIW